MSLYLEITEMHGHPFTVRSIICARCNDLALNCQYCGNPMCLCKDRLAAQADTDDMPVCRRVDCLEKALEETVGRLIKATSKQAAGTLLQRTRRWAWSASVTAAVLGIAVLVLLILPFAGGAR